MELTVADQGTGLSKEKMKNLFMRFDSDEKEIMSIQPGTGIGLSLSKELAELHQAVMTAESEEGMGATFRIVFKLGFSHFDNSIEFVVTDGQNPLAARSTIAEKNDSGEGGDEDEKEEDEPVLLFVEDNEELRSFLKIILSDSFHVIEAGNGSEGFEIARSQLPDIIITDLMMPGWTVWRWPERSGRRPPLPIYPWWCSQLKLTLTRRWKLSKPELMTLLQSLSAQHT